MRMAKGDKTEFVAPERRRPGGAEKGELPGRLLLHPETACLANSFVPCFKTHGARKMPAIIEAFSPRAFHSGLENVENLRFVISPRSWPRGMGRSA